MRFAVRPTAAALDDAVEIAERIRDAGYPDNADRWFTCLMEAMARLADFPARCGLAPETAELGGQEIRHLGFGEYRILFTIVAHSVFVLHIRHGRRRTASYDELADALSESPD